MYDDLSDGIDELLLARLELDKIEIPCATETELMQLRQKVYMRGKRIRDECEKSGNLNELYRAASTFTVTPFKQELYLLLQGRDNIVGVSSIKDTLKRISAKRGSNELEKLADPRLDTNHMLDELENIKKSELSNPFYTRDK
mgnify:CR=1 FL=1